ncbi:hypothetical protein BKA67DRAFT_220811 [Truncatella angustata]|uniref:Uncharacterized protein n=1 Tax=Truncatella angustata TaxID=152316 RepID=A0A9P8UVF6_9PEZI|nr:uncharacterized protein BKA67DRAFT_220811 [Truncatella angustata]KAH6658740.1 hypothetical protein BKA67DRAFT_220811 [Truncatella angustata]
MPSRLFMRSAVRAASRQAQSARLGARRGYASQHGASKSSDMPWLGLLGHQTVACRRADYQSPSCPFCNLMHDSHAARLIASVGITIPGVAYLLSSGPVKAETHGASARESKGESPSTNDDPGQTSLQTSGGDNSGATPNKAPMKGDNKETAQPGQDVPPPSSDNTSMSENFDEKKEKHEDYKETVCDSNTCGALQLLMGMTELT